MDQKINYYSTNQLSPLVSFSEALMRGQAPDIGLYMPTHIPSLGTNILLNMAGMNYQQIAFHVLYAFLKDEIHKNVLLELVTEAYDYAVPLEKVYERKYIMRLDRGPTASFKDFAARMMARLMSHYLSKSERRLLILTATSGDTGSAIANAFHGLDNINVLVLFPETEVTTRQRKQMTTLGGNISVLAIDGKFDDCQAMVKKAFADPDLAQLDLSSANSINIGRLLPQAVYYFYAWAMLRKHHNEKAIFVVPSGNFGDLMGGMIAWRMGLPVERIVVAVNENDEFPEFLKSGEYAKIEPSRNCISSAMNVGHPSNLARLVDLYGGKMDEKGNINMMPDIISMNKDLYAVSVSDNLTKKSITDAWHKHDLLLEPHGAVGWAGLNDYLASSKQDLGQKLFVVLETAHPAKFPEQIERILGFDPEPPASLAGIENKEEHYLFIQNNYEQFKTHLLKNY